MDKNTNMKSKTVVPKTKATNLGFTLIELLVVAATAPVMIGLLLPAVQKICRAGC